MLASGAGPSPAALSEGPLPALRALIAAGTITADPAQVMAAEKLQDLWRRTRGYDPKTDPPDTGGFLVPLLPPQGDRGSPRRRTRWACTWSARSGAASPC